MKIKALAVNQWLSPEWNSIITDSETRNVLPHQFYIFSASAAVLKKLTGVYRRDDTKPPAEDLGIQRKHREDRSQEILRYVLDGFPLSRIDKKKLVDPTEARSLQMPGWLPTAVVINILKDNDVRGINKRHVEPNDLVRVSQDSNSTEVEIIIPDHYSSVEWQPIIHPIEVIDGQHRLWAFVEPESGWDSSYRERLESVQIPVVAFHGLGITWQAYLFYTINQLPKKIDTSLVFDLYPLLRNQDWLLRFEGPNIYRETRAQDLTILMWQHPSSPWKDRIERHGGRTRGKVAQAAFLRSLMASLIKRWNPDKPQRIGGLFGSPAKTHETVLPWDREQQAAFLIFSWKELEKSIISSDADWAHKLLYSYSSDPNPQQLFSGSDTLIATDQGVRGFLCVLNDMLVYEYNNYPESLDLEKWEWQRKSEHDDNSAIDDALVEMGKKLPLTQDFIRILCQSLKSFDWRVSSVMDIRDENFSTQASYRGSGGYRIMRRNLLDHIRTVEPKLKERCEKVMAALNFESDMEDM